MLTHQAQRFNSPSLIVLNHDAREFPNLKEGPSERNYKFDRVLCDVPCSGDGTLRKNTGLWKKWHPHFGHANHSLQISILERAFKLVKTGGRLVYSTCSFNPIEDEAVVAAVLEKVKGQFELVDISKEASPEL